MNITIRYFAALRERLGMRQEVVAVDQGIQVKDLLRSLSEKHGDKFAEFVFETASLEPKRNLQFLINGKNISSLDGLLTELGDGDEFAIIPPVGGG